MIALTCPGCGKALKVHENLAGKKARCPACGQVVHVPEPAAARSPVPDGAATQAFSPGASPGPEAATLPPAERPPPSEAPTVPPADAPSEPAPAGPRTAPSTEDAQLTEFLAPPQRPDEIGRLGPYRVLKVLGAGGMGVVFMAEDPQLDRLVALKAMLPALAASPSAKQRFFREARAAAGLKHPHVVTIFHVGEERGAPFLVMEFLEGEPLDQRLKRAAPAPLPVGEVLRVGGQVADGLAAAHERGLVHRDIKPANIWLEKSRAEPGAAGPGYSVKILDFGLARALADQTQLTQQGAVIGTPAYMAPEQAGGRPVDHRCDLFSLGCVLYRMATGQMAFKGQDTIAILSAIALETPAAPADLNPEVPLELSDLILALLAKEPDGRPASAREVAAALRGLEAERGKTALIRQPPKPPRSAAGPPPPNGRAGRRRRPLLPAAVGGLLAAAAVAAIVVFWQTPHGTVRIESDDPAVEVVFDKTGPTIKGADKEPITLRAGEHGLLIKRGDFSFETDRFFLKRGEAVTLKVELFGGTLRVVRDGQVLAAPALPLPRQFANKLGMEFVLVPRGKSWLGGGGGTPGEQAVEVAHDFYLGKYEVTQEEWQKVTGLNPSRFQDVPGVSPAEQKRFPVEQVSWEDAQDFVARLNKAAKEPGWVYRLPTEAEWEYACRGGPLSDRLESAFSYYLARPANELLSGQANFEHPKALKRPTKVGSYAPNRLGLHDMHGNVWEWCADAGKVEDGVTTRVFRGGSLEDEADVCAAATRNSFPPSVRYSNFGLRLARVPAGVEVVRPAAAAKPSRPPEAGPSAFTNRLGMDFVLVPRGKSWLGGGGGTAGEREVVIPEDFYLGKYEVTQEEWEKVTGANPSAFKDVQGVPRGDQKHFPVEQVSWDDAQAFLARLNEQAQDEGWVYRLPTLAEWEYACRGGPLGDREEGAFDFYLAKPANELLPEQANFEHPKALKRPTKVGSYAPNRLGLHDMHGNVWEWCADVVPADPKDANRASRRTIRGGAWTCEPGECTATIGFSFVPSFQGHDIGLRVARVRADKDRK